MRVYPLNLVSFLNCRAQRYAFETQVLTRAAWAGCPILEVPVRCRYGRDGARVSHFRPWVDSWRSAAMHLPLVLRALLPWPHRRWERAPAKEHVNLKSILKDFNPAAAWRELRRDSTARPALSVALALGVLIANLPLYGLQTLLGLYAARRLHLNSLAVVLGTQLSMPPIGPMLIAAAIALGHLVLHGTWPALRHFDFRQVSVLRVLLVEWTLGGVLIGVILGVITFFVSLRLLRGVAPVEGAEGV